MWKKIDKEELPKYVDAITNLITNIDGDDQYVRRTLLNVSIGTFKLYLYENGEAVGILITEVNADNLGAQIFNVVYGAHSSEQPDMGFFMEGHAFLKDEAKKSGCTVMSCLTANKALMKLMNVHDGIKTKAYLYEEV